MSNFGVKRVLVVCGAGNIDEITTTGETKVSEVTRGQVSTYVMTPKETGLPLVSLTDLKGGETVEESARQLREVLQGLQGPRYDMVILNAGAALLAAEKAGTLQDGMALAAETISSGAALAKLEALVEFCKNV